MTNDVHFILVTIESLILMYHRKIYETKFNCQTFYDSTKENSNFRIYKNYTGKFSS